MLLNLTTIRNGIPTPFPWTQLMSGPDGISGRQLRAGHVVSTPDDVQLTVERVQRAWRGNVVARLSDGTYARVGLDSPVAAYRPAERD